ncbi:MAG: hypothetical protein AAB217_26930 [Chloroflexota bacterium]
MVIPKWISWAGFLAIVGGSLAILLTAPFATAYYAAYPGFDIPPVWLPSVRLVLRPLLTFASPVEVYNLYGRVFNLVYLLFLPAILGLHHLHQGTGKRLEPWGFGLLVVGLLATFIGVAGDYWLDGITFFLELLGLLILSIGAVVYGVAIVRSKVLPGWCGWLLVSCLPGVFVFLQLIGHIPSGPTLPFAIVWLVIGYLLLRKSR